MAKVTATIRTQSKSVPVGPAQVGLLVSLIASTGSVFAKQTVSSAPYAAVFDNVTPDTYTVTAQPIDSTGALIDVVLKSDAFSIDPAPAPAPSPDPAPAPAPVPDPAPAPSMMTIDAPILISVTQS